MDSYRRLSCDQLKEDLRRGESVLLLDLRTPSQFKEGHIAGSMNLPLSQLHVEQFLSQHQSRPLILICQSGKLADQAADSFFAGGFYDLLILAGGILSWQMLGFPLAKV